MALNLSRDVKVYVKQTTPEVFWEIPVLDGYSFSQAVSSSEITLSEMTLPGGVSRRGKTMFNDALEATEWSFSTYARPILCSALGANNWEYTATGTVDSIHSIEEFILGQLVGTPTYTWLDGSGWDDSVTTVANTTGAESSSVDWLSSDSPALGTFTLYFVFDEDGAAPVVYEIQEACVNSGSMDFDVEGITTWNFSGMGKSIAQLTSGDTTTMLAAKDAAVITEGITATDNFIRNRLTTLSITATDTATFPGASTNGVYNIALTGGSISFENNMSFLVPETLGVVNQPIEHVTGSRSIGGSFTAYLASGTAGDSASFFDALAAATDVTTNEFDVIMQVGGTTSGTARIYIDMPQCHFEVPSHNIEDVIAIEASFTALPSDLSDDSGASGDEATLQYFPKV